MEKENQSQTPNKSVKIPKKENSNFQFSKKYFTISVYALAVVFISALIIKAIFSWAQLVAAFQAIIKVLLPFLAGGLIAYILNPFYKKVIIFLNKTTKIKNQKLLKALALLLAYISVLGLFSITLLYIIPQIIDSIERLSKMVPLLYNNIYNFLNTFEERYPDIDVEYIIGALESFEPMITEYAANIAKNVVPILYTASMSLINFFFNALIAVIVSIYVLADKERLLYNFKRLMFSLIPNRKINYYVETLKECNRILSSFIVGKSIDSLIIGILCFIAMSILQLPYALLISVIVGITNMIPYFGPFIGAVPGALLLLLMDPIKALIFLILVLVLQQFDGLVLGPKILGDSTGLKPLWIVFAITIGGSIAGVAGMFFGVPVVAVISYLLNRFLDNRLKQKNIQM